MNKIQNLADLTTVMQKSRNTEKQFIYENKIKYNFRR